MPSAAMYVLTSFGPPTRRSRMSAATLSLTETRQSQKLAQGHIDPRIRILILKPIGTIHAALTGLRNGQPRESSVRGAYGIQSDFYVYVTIVSIELMCTLALDVRAYRDSVTTYAARPFFRRIEQQLSNTVRAELLVDNPARLSQRNNAFQRCGISTLRSSRRFVSRKVQQRRPHIAQGLAFHRAALESLPP